MTFKKLLIATSIILNATAAFAIPHSIIKPELAANAVTIKQAVVDNQVTMHQKTEVFMALINKGFHTHTLVAATSPAAKQVQLHKTTQSHGQSVMQQVPGITIKSHTEKNLHLGGLHVMLIGLKKHLVKNNKVPITLIFSDGSWKTINASVS